MKVLVFLTLCACTIAAVPKQKDTSIENEVLEHPTYSAYAASSGLSKTNLPTTTEELLLLLRNFVNNVIFRGWPQFGIPPLEPLMLTSYDITIPAGIIFLDLKLKGILATGFSNYIVHKSELDINDLSFDIDIEFPFLNIKATEYDMTGNIYTAIPLYGKGRANFLVGGFRFQAKLFLKQSDDGKSVLIDRVENAAYSIPHLKSDLTGAIGGGEIDAIVNALIEDVIMHYVNRFHGAIAILTSSISTTYGNPFLAELDSWRYIAALLPRK